LRFASEAVKKIGCQTDEADFSELYREVFCVLIDTVTLMKNNHCRPFTPLAFGNARRAAITGANRTVDGEIPVVFFTAMIPPNAV
jgi:hypothetical protein